MIALLTSIEVGITIFKVVTALSLIILIIWLRKAKHANIDTEKSKKIRQKKEEERRRIEAEEEWAKFRENCRRKGL